MIEVERMAPPISDLRTSTPQADEVKTLCFLL